MLKLLVALNTLPVALDGAVDVGGTVEAVHSSDSDDSELSSERHT